MYLFRQVKWLKVLPQIHKGLKLLAVSKYSLKNICCLLKINNFTGKTPPGRKYLCTVAYAEGLGENATAYDVMTKGKNFPLPKKIEEVIKSSKDPNLLFLFIDKMRSHHYEEVKLLRDQIQKLNFENEALEVELATNFESADAESNDNDA